MNPMKTFGLLLIVTVLNLAAADSEKAAKIDDRKAIQGTWKFVSVSEGGKKRDMPEGIRVTFNKELMMMHYPDKQQSGWKYKIDPSKDPREMEWLPEEDPGHPIEQPGIYELKGDRLRIHMAAAGTPRPKNFDEKKGEPGGVWVLERLRPPSDSK